jgi:hypothetical protein
VLLLWLNVRRSLMTAIKDSFYDQEARECFICIERQRMKAKAEESTRSVQVTEWSSLMLRILMLTI